MYTWYIQSKSCYIKQIGVQPVELPRSSIIGDRVCNVPHGLLKNNALNQSLTSTSTLDAYNLYVEVSP